MRWTPAGHWKCAVAAAAVGLSIALTGCQMTGGTRLAEGGTYWGEKTPEGTPALYLSSHDQAGLQRRLAKAYRMGAEAAQGLSASAEQRTTEKFFRDASNYFTAAARISMGLEAQASGMKDFGTREGLALNLIIQTRKGKAVVRSLWDAYTWGADRLRAKEQWIAAATMRQWANAYRNLLPEDERDG